MQNQIIPIEKLTLTLQEVAALCGLKAPVVRVQIRREIIVPAFPGSNSNPHRFSPQQTPALAVIAALARSPRGCSTTYGKQVMACFEAMSDTALEEYLGLRADDYTAEAAAQWRNTPDAAPAFLDRGNSSLPGDQETIADMGARLDRVEDAIRQRVGLPAPDRTSATKKPAGARSRA